MVTSRTRISGAVRVGAHGSGGPESEALMSYLAMVKDQCKPPVYSAFISLINAYHGDMLAADALLDELAVLFSPRVFLLAGIKPLVDKSYYSRVDELCGKIRSSSSRGGRSGGISTQASLNCSSNGRNNSEIVATNTMRASAATPKLELGERGILSNYRGGVSESGNIPSSSPSGNTGGNEAGRLIRGDVKLGGSSGFISKSVSAASSSSPQRAVGCSTGGVQRESEQQLGAKSTISSPSPDAGALESDGADIGELLSDMEPTVDPALLEFMMRDNSPVVGSSTAQVDPPSLTLQQTQQQQEYHHQQHQQQQQQQHWSSTTLDQALLGCTSPTRREAGGSPSIDPSSTVGHTPPSWHRSESATSLPELSCRIHASPNVGCRACREGGDSEAVTTAASVGPARGHRLCSVAISSSSSSRGSSSSRDSPAGPRRSNLPVGRRGSFAGPGASSPSGSEGPNLEDERFLGPGKRVWNERGNSSGRGGSGGTASMTTPSSPSAPQDSFFFPAAAAAVSAGNGKSNGNKNGTINSNGNGNNNCNINGNGNDNWTVSSRPHIRRRISTDPSANGMEERTTEKRNDQSLSSRSSNVSNGGGERLADRMGSTGSGGLNSDPMSSEFDGIRSTPSVALRHEQHSPSSTGGAEGGPSLSKSGSDLEKVVMNVAIKGMQQALQYGLRHTFSVILHKKDREIAELKEEVARWAENDMRLRQLNQQLLNDNMQLRAAAGWETRSSSSPS